MEGVYYIGEQLRWNLGFPQPNAGGAFAAMVVSMLWVFVLLPIGRKAAILKWLCFVLGSFGSYCLMMTFSRGGLVALLVSLTFCGVLITLKAGRRWKAVSLKLILMLAVLTVVTQAVGLGERMAAAGMFTGDSSTARRLELWTAGLQMIHLKPVFGWGVGESGNIYMNWFQRLDGTHQVAGMINSYLHVATERGLPFLMLVLLPFTTLVFVCIRSFWTSDPSSDFAKPVYSLCLAVFMSFAVANFFSTLWIFKHLWWLPSAAALIALSYPIMSGRASLLPGSIKYGAIGTATILGLIYIAGVIADISSPVSRFEDGYLVFESPSGERQEALLVFGDETVLGQGYGKRVRQLAVDGVSVMAPASDSVRSLPQQPFDKLICCGAREPDFNSITTGETEIIILNPLFDPPEQIQGKTVRIILGSLRPKPKQIPWIRSSESNSWQLEILKGFGQDLRNVWPIFLQPEIQSKSLISEACLHHFGQTPLCKP